MRLAQAIKRRLHRDIVADPVLHGRVLNLYLNGELIPFDQLKNAAEGWGWANPEKSAIDLYGGACSAFKTNRKTSINVEFGCPAVVLL